MKNNHLIKNDQLSEFPLNEDELNKLVLPKVDKSMIYHIGTSHFKGKNIH